MNVEKLYKISNFIFVDITNNSISEKFNDFVSKLNTFINNMQQPDYQTSFIESKNIFFDALIKSEYNNLSFFEIEIINEIGGKNLLGNDLKNKLKKIIEENQMTPAQASKEITPIHNNYKNFISYLSALNTSLENLNIEKDNNLEAGQGVISILFPRAIINGEFDLFESDIKLFRRFFDTLFELSCDENKYQILKISSSDFVFDLLGWAGFICLIAQTINPILDVFQKSLSIKKTLDDMKEQNAPAEIINNYEKFKENTIDEDLIKIAKSIIEQSKLQDTKRKKELNNSLLLSLKRITAKLDNGYQINISINETEIVEGEEESETNIEHSEISELREQVNKLNNNNSNVNLHISTKGQILMLPAFSDDDDSIED